MDASPKTVREYIARSKFHLQRSDMLKALKALAHALDLLAASQIFGRERIEIGVLLDEGVRQLMDQDMMKRSVPGGLSYVKGKEKDLSAQLKRLAAALEEALNKLRTEERRKALMELDELVLEGQAALERKEPLEARRLFRKAVEQFGDEPGLFVDLGNRLMLAGLPAEATEYFQKSIETSQNDMRAYTLLTQCLEALGETDKAEDLMRATLRRFGPNEAILVRLGKAALARRNWEEAMACARGAVELNPGNQEAQRIGGEASARVFGDPKGFLEPEAKRSEAAGKAITLDF